MKNLYTYDPQHQINFSRQGITWNCYFEKGDTTFQNSNMLSKFLDAYELSEQTFHDIANFEQLLAHFQMIEKKYAAYPKEIELNGIPHLLAQKAKNIVSPYAQEIFELQHTHHQHLEALIRNYFQQQAAAKLPVVEWTKYILKQDILKDRYKKALDNTLLVLVQQGFSSVEEVIKGIIELGFPPARLVVMTKPHTTSDTNKSAFQALAAKLNFHYPQVTQDDLSDDDDKESDSQFDSDRKNAMNKVAKKVQEILMTPDDVHPIQHIAIHDEGGKLFNHKYFKNKLKARYPDLEISTSEHTMSGMNTRKDNQKSGNHGLTATCHDMAECWLKADKESLLIADASFEVVKADIDQLIDDCHPIPPILAVAGIGNIGSKFVEYLIRHYEGKIKLVLKTKDIHNEKFQNVLLLAAQKEMLDQDFHPNYDLIKDKTTLLEKKFHETCSAKNIEEYMKRAQMLFGCSGHNITSECKPEHLQSSIEHTVKLYSLSSGQREFETLLGHSVQQTLIDQDIHRSYQNLKLEIKNSGLPIIFCNRDDGVAPDKIQLIRALTITTICQHLEYLSLVDTIKDTKEASLVENLQKFQVEHHFLQLDIALQISIWNAFQRFQQAYIDSNRGEILLPTLGIWDEFLKDTPTVGDILKKSRGDMFSSACQDFAPFNYVLDFDKNHKLHLSYLDKKLELVFKKDKQPVYDVKLLKTLLTPYFDLDEFYACSDLEKVQLIQKTVIGPTQNRFFKPEAIPINSEEKLNYATSCQIL